VSDEGGGIQKWVMSILHKNRGRKPANALDPDVAEAITRIYQAELSGYNFCHATDVLAEEKDIFVSVSTVSRYLKANGIRSPKAKRRPKKHRSRNARESEGEMAQMDASLEQANDFLKQYISYYNRKFAVQAINPEKAYLPKQNMFELQLIFAKHETRKLNSGLSFSFDNHKYRLPDQAAGCLKSLNNNFFSPVS
jgi:hypothetical protein